MVPGEELTGRHTLGPHVVGLRVVVRRVLRGPDGEPLHGPTGGPAMTDALGVCESWDTSPEGSRSLILRSEDGTLTEIPLADVVSGKPVPPRVSPRLRVSAEEMQRRLTRALPAARTEQLGEWLLRLTGGPIGRVNTALALGDPGVSLAEATQRVCDFYRRHDRPAWADVVVGSAEHTGLEELGWSRARPDQADASMLLASLAQARRRLGPQPAPPDMRVEVQHEVGELPDDWWQPRSAQELQVMRVPFAGAGCVAFVSLLDGDRQVARVRASYDDGWVDLTDLRVRPQSRRAGLARLMLAEALAWAGERGADTVQLSVVSDNVPARGLYHALGFAEHHRYRYLTAPAAADPG